MATIFIFAPQKRESDRIVSPLQHTQESKEQPSAIDASKQIAEIYRAADAVKRDAETRDRKLNANAQAKLIDDNPAHLSREDQAKMKALAGTIDKAMRREAVVQRHPIGSSAILAETKLVCRAANDCYEFGSRTMVVIDKRNALGQDCLRLEGFRRENGCYWTEPLRFDDER